MPSKNQNVEVYAGDTHKLRFTVMDVDAVTPLNLTGATIKWWLARKNADGSFYRFITKTSADPSEVLPGDAGVFDVFLRSGDTLNLPAGLYYHEAEVVTTDGTVATVSVGTFHVKPSIKALG